jgi:hypothetical protein
MNVPLFKPVLQVISWHPVQQVRHFFISPHRQTENEFLSMHLSVWETGKSHRGLNLVNRGMFKH